MHSSPPPPDSEPPAPCLGIKQYPGTVAESLKCAGPTPSGVPHAVTTAGEWAADLCLCTQSHPAHQGLILHIETDLLTVISVIGVLLLFAS